MSKKSRKRRELANSRVPLSFNRHFIPPLAGLVVAILIFGFFDANLLSGQINYYLLNKKAARLSPAETRTAPPVNPKASQISIRDLGIQAPVNFSESSSMPNSILNDEQVGVVHFPGTALPGQRGNLVLVGRSSDDWWAPGGQKFVFSLLNKLPYNDLIYVGYKGHRFVYRVYDAKVVSPSKLSVLSQGSSYMLTLVTAAPTGSGSMRLIVRAQQVSPHVQTDTSYDKPPGQPPVPGGRLPGQSGSFWYNFKRLI